MMREYRLFFVKLPNGLMCREIFNITKPICELREKLCDHIGAGRLSIENSCMACGAVKEFKIVPASHVVARRDIAVFCGPESKYAMPRKFSRSVS